MNFTHTHTPTKKRNRMSMCKWTHYQKKTHVWNFTSTTSFVWMFIANYWLLIRNFFLPKGKRWRTKRLFYCHHFFFDGFNKLKILSIKTDLQGIKTKKKSSQPLPIIEQWMKNAMLRLSFFAFFLLFCFEWGYNETCNRKSVIIFRIICVIIIFAWFNHQCRSDHCLVVRCFCCLFGRRA